MHDHIHKPRNPYTSRMGEGGDATGERGGATWSTTDPVEVAGLIETAFGAIEGAITSVSVVLPVALLDRAAPDENHRRGLTRAFLSGVSRARNVEIIAWASGDETRRFDEWVKRLSDALPARAGVRCVRVVNTWPEDMRAFLLAEGVQASAAIVQGPPGRPGAAGVAVAYAAVGQPGRTEFGNLSGQFGKLRTGCEEWVHPASQRVEVKPDSLPTVQVPLRTGSTGERQVHPASLNGHRH